MLPPGCSSERGGDVRDIALNTLIIMLRAAGIITLDLVTFLQGFIFVR